MLHGLKKLWFSTSNTHSVSDDKKAAAAVEAQNQNFIVLCFFQLTVCLKCALFSCSASQSPRADVFYFEAIVYLLSQKLVWIIPKPSSSTQIVPPPHLKREVGYFCAVVSSVCSYQTNANKQWTIRSVCLHHKGPWPPASARIQTETFLFFSKKKSTLRQSEMVKPTFQQEGSECNITRRR